MRVKNAACDQHSSQYLFRSENAVDKPNMPYIHDETHTMIVHRNTLIAKDVAEGW
jgi:hypothetical protein